MVVFSTGVMGAGKSFESVCRLYSYFGKDKKTKDYLKTKFNVNKEIKFFRTNIPYNKSSFDYDESLDTSFKFNKFYEKIEILHLDYLDDHISEDELKLKADELGISNTLYLIDECQNYLDKANNVLIFFFTYHRHFNCEVVLITQNLSLVNYKYKGFCEQFIRAVPSTFNLFSTSFTYKYFPNSRMSAKELFKTVKLKKMIAIYEAYVSGGKVFTNNVIKKIIFVSLSSLLFLILFTYYVLNFYFVGSIEESKTPESKEEPKKEQIQTHINNPVPQTQTTQQPNNQYNQPILDNTKIEEDTTNLKLYKFNCFKDFCYYKQDKQITIEIPMPFLIAISKDMDKSNKYMLFEKNRTVIYLLANEEKFNFIKGVQNENKEDGNSLMPTVGIPN